MLGEGWKRGPLPPQTWNWGAVVPTGMEAEGFYFADFHGDHVIMSPSTQHERRLSASEVAFYNNSIGLPPHGVSKRL